MGVHSRLGPILLLQLLLGTARTDASTPDLSKYRTSKVADTFETGKLGGLWYEVAYHDIAMLGASCPTLLNSANETSIEQTFSVRYGPLPFSLNLTYLPAGEERGLYLRHKEGVGSFLIFATVVVDFFEGSDGSYTHFIELTAKDVVAGAAVYELRFLSRTPSLDAAMFESMSAVIRERGIMPQLVSQLEKTDWHGCGQLEVAASSAPAATATPADSQEIFA